MTARAIFFSQRRGACPGLSVPMPTGDGLLVRLNSIGTIPLAAFQTFCATAREHGNGTIEVTARSSIQARGFTVASAPRFADAVAAIAIAAADGVPVFSNALAGLDPDELLDAGTLAADLRQTLTKTPLAARLAPKVSVVVDGGGVLDVEELAADVRLRADFINGAVALNVGVGGDRATEAHLGAVAPARGVEAAIRLLTALAQRGPATRARDILKTEGFEPLRAALTGVLLTDVPKPAPHLHGPNRKSAIGLHRLRDGSLACGIGLAFGHADAPALLALAETAGAAGAIGLRAAPRRALMIIGLSDDTAPAFVDGAEQLGFIVRADDPRRHVVACAGAPICASAHIAARAMAPSIAEIVAPVLDGSFTVHISGCAKGCAHPAPAALTAVGTPDGCALVADGSARDVPFTTIAADELPAAIARTLRRRRSEDRHV